MDIPFDKGSVHHRPGAGYATARTYGTVNRSGPATDATAAGTRTLEAGRDEAYQRRCAVCGQKGLFRRWVVMAERCPRCGFRFERAPGQWLGSWFLNICLAQMLAILIVIAGVVVAYPHPPILALFVIGVVAMVVFPIWFFPYSRTLWVAIDLAMTPLEFGEGVDP